MPRGDPHRSLAKKYADYDRMAHSTWEKDERPATSATVSVPGKSASFSSRLFGAAGKAAGSSIRKSVTAARGLFTGGTVDPADPHAAQRRKADTKQRGMKGLQNLITGVRTADLVAGHVKRIIKK